MAKPNPFPFSEPISFNGKVAVILAMVVFFACGTSEIKNSRPNEFVKGVYGNPASLLKAGYRLDSLGINAVFVRSHSLNREFYETARSQGCKVFVEFPTLNGKSYLEDQPDAWPVNEYGENSPPADWFMGICPSNSAFKKFRSDQLFEILNEYQIDGVFLDYLHWHAQFETSEPILPETCFCENCTDIFEKVLDSDIPGQTIRERASWILDNRDREWRIWRNSILNGWVEDMGAILKQIQPKAKLGVFYCSWYPTDHDDALFRTLGIDVAGLAARADVLSPMLFHRMKDRPTIWVGQYLNWLDEVTDAANKGIPLVWPIVQAHNNPNVVSPEEFRAVMLEGSRPPATGIMMFSDQSLLQDSLKIKVMKNLYRDEIDLGYQPK